MAHFAKVNENNIVIKVHVVDNEHLLNEDGVEKEALGIAYLNEVYGALPTGFTWVQTSYNANFRKQYCGGGFTYDKVNDVFISLKPYPSWTLDASFDWQAPTAMPDDGKLYTWDEDKKVWEYPPVYDQSDPSDDLPPGITS